MEEEQKVLTADDKRKMLYYGQKVKKAFKLFVGDTHKDGDDLYIQKGLLLLKFVDNLKGILGLL